MKPELRPIPRSGVQGEWGTCRPQSGAELLEHDGRMGGDAQATLLKDDYVDEGVPLRGNIDITAQLKRYFAPTRQSAGATAGADG